MKKAFVFLAPLVVSALANAGCTFYTACPAGNTDPMSNAGTNSGTGGSSSNGGDQSSGGSAITGPLPTGEFVNVGASLAKLVTGGGDLMVVSAVPNSPRVIAGIASAGLWATDDGGESWIQLGDAEGSAVINNGPLAIVYDPEHPDTFWENGIYGDCAFRTDDAGKSFKRLGGALHCDLVSVDFSDPDRLTLLAGPHETPNVLSLSVDGGEMWEDVGPNLPEDSNFSTLPLIIDSETFLVGSCGFGNGKCGVFRSTDGGAQWDVVSSDGPAAAPLRASDDTIYWALYRGGMIVSEDLGKTWTKASPAVVPSNSGSLNELPDGRILALGEEYPLVTDDKGKTWKPVGGKLPFKGGINCAIYGMTYSAELRAIFVNHNDCSGFLKSDAVWTVPFDYEAE